MPQHDTSNTSSSANQVAAVISTVDFAGTDPVVVGYAYSRADDPKKATEIPESDLEADLYRHPALTARSHLSLSSVPTALRPNDAIRTRIGTERPPGCDAANGQTRSPRRPSYCKAFDVFSVGCMLLELGLWESLTSITSRLSDSEDGGSRHTDLMRLRDGVFIEQLQRKQYPDYNSGIIGELQAMMGERYCALVVDLMTAWDRQQRGTLGESSLLDQNPDVDGVDVGPEARDDRSVSLLELEMACLERLRKMKAVL
jgi:hypothetical protein